ncbi:unnamed protein product [Rotaria magnacalcarata]|uniref:G-protein coupled receptors family 1 profile domain-containing protein n=1 Tax=Rotaria magnacalcarata TaxID=392030 RepID=A0A816SX56_9BILA|nr:unnamed protein product [Rotaria magnacalcarata]CAF2201605.1 unnamed protein product [Rotaria magnacalcarata]CAF4240886.1 unnamed protein product [Rotaria magnacalcarata]CAF4304952.1 unnamed protein product [Rotaria magnacalcarata]
MSSSSTSSHTIAWLNNMNVQFNRYLPWPFLILGTVGVILNIIIFTRRSLFINSCTHYLLGNTVANAVVLYWVATTRIFSDGYNIDPSVHSNTFCRLRYFFTYVPRTLSTWFILLACIDRWASSVKAQRRFNSVLFARIVIVITTTACFLSFCNVLIYFGVQKTATSTTCYAMPGPYRFFSDLQYLTFYALGPPVIMLVFGLATLRNLRRARNQVLPHGVLSSNTNARRDTQLLIMLLMQVALIIVFTVPFAGQKLYDTLALAEIKSPLKTAQNNLCAGILRILSYGSHAFGFFVYTLSARIFRKELLKTINGVYQRFTGRNLNIAMDAQTCMTQIQTVEMKTVYQTGRLDA